MHPTIRRMIEVGTKGDVTQIVELLAEDVQFRPPTYWQTWTGLAPVTAALHPLGKMFRDVRYRPVIGDARVLKFREALG